MPRGIPNKARNNPVVLNGGIESAEQAIAQGPDRTLSSTGDANTALSREPSLIQVADRPLEAMDPEKLAMLAFFDEKVTVRIATTTDRNADQIFEITINGKTEMFRRGETKTVKRMFVDRMARLKSTTYDHEEVTNSEGIKQIVYKPSTALRYDFSVVRDDNPLGDSWLRSTLAERG